MNPVSMGIILAARIRCVMVHIAWFPGVDHWSTIPSTSDVESFASNRLMPSSSLDRIVRREQCEEGSARGQSWSHLERQARKVLDWM